MSEDYEALALADILAEAAKPENVFTGYDLHSADGELFDGYGSLENASSRLDPAYMKASSARARNRAHEALGRVKPQSGEHLRMLTLTMPPLYHAEFGDVMQVLDRAIVLLKKRKWFKEQVRGAVIGTEFTLGKANDHYHAHCHMLAWSRWIVWAELGEQWSSCLKQAAATSGVALEFETEHGQAVVDVRLVTSKRRGRGTVSMEDAVEECCKYTCKGSDFARIPVEELCAVERYLRGRRMIETFGECNARKGRVKQEQGTKEQDTYLDKNCIFDGSDAVSTQGLEDGTAQNIPLRMRGAQMIRQGQRSTWLKLLKKTVRKRQEWRKTQLAERFPYATFRTLAGDEWGWRTKEGIEYEGWRDNL
jgi:hypothetical protein